jgi:hypothetical protein
MRAMSAEQFSGYEALKLVELLRYLLMNAWGNAPSSTVFGVTIRIHARLCCDPAIQK